MTDPVQQAINIVGMAKLAAELGVRYQSILGWQERGRMPRTEWTGETNYSESIERLTQGKVTKEQLLRRPWQFVEQAA